MTTTTPLRGPIYLVCVHATPAGSLAHLFPARGSNHLKALRAYQEQDDAHILGCAGLSDMLIEMQLGSRGSPDKGQFQMVWEV